MAISDILVYADPTATSAERLDIAFRLAHRFEAYLIGVVPEDAAAVGEKFEKMLLNEVLLGEWHMAIGLTEPFVTQLGALCRSRDPRPTHSGSRHRTVPAGRCHPFLQPPGVGRALCRPSARPASARMC